MSRTTSVGPLGAVLAATTITLALTGCVANGGSESAGNIRVESTADACKISASTAPSGPISFDVTNSTNQATEFYILAGDGLKVVGELENIAPGAPRTLTVSMPAGDYFTVCKPGMVGAGVGKTAFTVSDSGSTPKASGAEADQISAAADNYVSYVKDQVAQLIPATQGFVDSYVAGNDDTARSLYPVARSHYERIEPVAESFGVLDQALDFREADVPSGDEWTGWHRLEKDLWAPPGYTSLTTEERATVGSMLVADTKALYDAVHSPDYTITIDSISNGAIGLMDEVASGKITGEEEIWSHTDLYDFQGNLEGARVAYEGVRDIVRAKDPGLVAQLDEEFTALASQLAAHGSYDGGFTPYDNLSASDIKALADGVNALSEPLSKLTAALVA